MIKDLPTISQKIQDMETTVRAFAFEWTKTIVKPVPGKVHTLSKQRPLIKYIYNCIVAWVDELPLVRSAAIDTEKKAEAFLALIRKATKAKWSKKRPLRLTVNYLSSVEFEWGLVEMENRFLIRMREQLSEDDQIAQISFGTDDLFTSRPAIPKVRSDQEALDEIPRYFNMDGWANYCAWYNELLEEAFSHFLYDALDAYTLERYLKDFKHEVFSPFLRWTRQQLAELELIELKQAQKNVSRRDRIDITQQRIACQADLRRMIESNYENLVEILRLISLIKKTSPGLLHLLEMGQVLQNLLADQLGFKACCWGKKHMLLQLLNDELGVVSAICGTVGLHRTNVAFAIRLAVLQMKILASREDIIDLALNWDEASKVVNKLFVQKGGGDAAKDIEDPSLQKRAILVTQFRERMLANLLDFCHPLVRLNTEVKISKWHKGMRENTAPLNFLPPYHMIPNAQNKLERTALVNYNPETGEPLSLTDAGRRLIT